MDKQFWKTIQENDCEIPEGHTVESLTPELLSFLGNTDSELHDDLAYSILVEWVDRDLYSPDDLRHMAANLGENRNTDAAQHLHILNGIRDKLMAASNWVYVHGEDDRLSRAVLGILRSDTLAEPSVQKWVNSFLAPKGGLWKGAWTKDDSTRAFFNVRNFLRSLYMRVSTEENLPKQGELGKMILKATQELRPF